MASAEERHEDLIDDVLLPDHHFADFFLQRVAALAQNIDEFQIVRRRNRELYASPESEEGSTQGNEREERASDAPGTRPRRDVN